MPPTAMIAILNALADVGPMTAAEMRTFFNKSVSSMYDPLRNLHKIKKLIHISDYQRNWHGRASPVYALGTQPDAVEQPLTHPERDKRYRARFKAVLQARRNKETLPIWKGLMR